MVVLKTEAKRSASLPGRFDRKTLQSFTIRLVSLFTLPTISLLATTFNYTGGLDSFTVADTATYEVIATGGSGGNVPFKILGNSDGGHGAEVTGFYNFTQGEVLNILVGGSGGNASSKFDTYGAGGGGGASIIQSTGGINYVIAGGGGGGGAQSGEDGTNGSMNATAGNAPGPVISSPQGLLGNQQGGSAGTNGGGGQGGGQSEGGGGGAGLQSSGTSGAGSHNGAGGALFSGNAAAGSNAGSGGFGGGGGGGGDDQGGGGGGGGYNGGGGGINGAGGGGGGSFSLDSAAIFAVSGSGGNGSITITELTSVTPVPEPGEVGLLVVAGVAFALRLLCSRRKRFDVTC